MKSYHHWLSHALIALLSSTLIGCGSSSSGGSAPSVSGTAATGAAISGGTVSAKCADSNIYTATSTTSSNGSYTISGIPGTAFPCALEVSFSGKTLHSYVESNGTANITPLTDMALALSTGSDPADWFTGFNGAPITDLSAHNTALLSALSGQGFVVPSTSIDPFTTAFSADHTGWDRMIDQLQQSLSNGGKSLQNLIDDIVTGGDASAALAAFTAPEPFTISGTVSGAAGKVHWELWVNNSLFSSGDASNGAVTFSPAGGVFNGSVFQLGTTQPSGQSCTLTNQSGTLTGDVTDITVTCVDTDPPSSVTVHSGLAGTYSLTYQQLAAGAPFTDSQSVSASISGNTLTVGGLVMDSPASVDSAPTAIAWTDSASGITYRVFNNTTGVFSEINLFNGSGTLLGQLSESSAAPNAVTAFSSLAGSYTPTVAQDDFSSMSGGTAVAVQVSSTGVVTLGDLTFDPTVTFDPADSSFTFQDRADNSGHFYELNNGTYRLRVYLNTDNEPVYWEVKQTSKYLFLTTPMPDDVIAFFDAVRDAGTHSLTVIANSTTYNIGTPRDLCSSYDLNVTGSSPNYQINWNVGDTQNGSLSYDVKTSIYQEDTGVKSIIVNWGTFFRLTLNDSGVLELEALNKWPLNTAFADPLTVMNHATTDATAIASICTP